MTAPTARPSPTPGRASCKQVLKPGHRRHRHEPARGRHPERNRLPTTARSGVPRPARRAPPTTTSTPGSSAYIPQLVTAVWVGDSPQPVALSDGGTARPLPTATIIAGYEPVLRSSVATSRPRSGRPLMRAASANLPVGELPAAGPAGRHRHPVDRAQRGGHGCRLGDRRARLRRLHPRPGRHHLQHLRAGHGRVHDSRWRFDSVVRRQQVTIITSSGLHRAAAGRTKAHRPRRPRASR